LTDWIIEDYEDSFDEDGREQLGLLKSRVSRMYQLLEGILRYSRIGRGQEEKEVLELNGLVNEVISTLLPPENFNIAITNELPPIFADKTKIYQVFQNIISNAIKYNDKPIGAVKVFCETKADGFHHFTIKDNGKGIPEEDFERVFKIFQTLEKDKDSAESTGVGLTLVQKIIQKYGGKISSASKVGEGTAFTFSLPPVPKE
jgi:signal transduction histidine kinase